MAICALREARPSVPTTEAVAGDPADADCVRRVRAGDVEAYAVLVRRYRERYARFAMHMLGDQDDAEDAMQDAFVRAYESLGRLEHPERFGAWLLSILANRCRTSRGRRARRERTFVPEEQSGTVGVDPPGDRSDLRAEIAAALAALPADQREAFLLHHVEDLDYERMHDVTGVGVSALKMRVKRARERLADRLAGVVP